MITDLPSTTTAAVNKKLVELRERGGAVALGRVLTMVIVTEDDSRTETVIDAANDASREHPCRVIVLARGTRRASARLDAQIRVGGDAGASEVIVLRVYGPLATEGASVVVPFLLPDAPVVAWWPGEAPQVPADDPVGKLAARRITDAAAAPNPVKALAQRREAYADGDTDLAWTRLTLWRGLLAAALDQPPYENIIRAVVSGAADSPSTDLMAAWLAACLDVPVIRAKADVEGGLETVRLERPSGDVTLTRPGSKVGTLTQPGQPERRVALQRRPLRDCLSEELRRLDPDQIYEAALNGLPKIRRGRAPAITKPTASTSSKTTASARAGTGAKAPTTGGTKATGAMAKTGARPPGAGGAKTATSAKAGATTVTAKSAKNGTGAKAKARVSSKGAKAGESSS